MNPKFIWLLAALLVIGVAASGPVLQKSSQAQAAAGTENSRYMTPLRTAQAITALGGGGSTNNLVLTGSTVIRTNLLVDSTGSATISPTNTLEVVHTNGLKLLTVSRNTGSVNFGTNVTAAASIIANYGSSGIVSYFGGYPTLESSYSGIWFTTTLGTVRDTGNYALLYLGSTLALNSSGGGAIDLRIANDPIFRVNSSSALSLYPFISSTTITATNGFASYAVAATNTLAATGITNTSSINRQVMVTATATSYQIKNSAGTVVAITPTLTSTLVWTLQPGGAVTAASGLAGNLLDW